MFCFIGWITVLNTVWAINNFKSIEVWIENTMYRHYLCKEGSLFRRAYFLSKCEYLELTYVSISLYHIFASDPSINLSVYLWFLFHWFYAVFYRFCFQSLSYFKSCGILPSTKEALVDIVLYPKTNLKALILIICGFSNLFAGLLYFIACLVIGVA